MCSEHREMGTPPTDGAVNASPFLLSRALRDVELTIRGESPDPQDDDYPGFLLARAIRSEVRSGSGLDGDGLTHLLAGMAFMGLESADLDYHAQRLLAALTAVTDGDGDDAPEPSSPLWRAIYESMSGQLRSESLSDLCAGILIERSRRTGVPAEESLDRYRRMVADGLVTENDWSTDDPSLRDI